MSNISYISAAQAVLPLTVYYDRSCVLCRSEIDHIKARDDGGQLRLVDCSPAGFDTSALPVNQAALMNSIHAIDAQGRWLKATDVFVVCYRAAGLGAVASTFVLAKPLLERMYPLIARYRHVFSALGVHKVFNTLTRKHLERKAKAAMAASQGCKDGACDIDLSTVKNNNGEKIK